MHSKVFLLRIQVVNYCVNEIKVSH